MFRRLSSSDCLTPVFILFVVALIIRFMWIFYVQQPQHSLCFDMKKYMDDAQALVSGTQERHWSVALTPYGIRYYYAFLMFLFGEENYTAFGVINVISGAVCVVCVTLAATYCLDSLKAVWVVGILACIWYPIISFSSYFLSEIPYSLFMYLALLFTFRYLNTGRGAALTGLLHGIAFTVRPQIIMTFVLFIVWAIVRRKSLCTLKMRGIFMLIFPVILIMGYSSYRYYHFTGNLGLICGLEPVNKLWGATKYVHCSGYEYKDGKLEFVAGFSLPSAVLLGYTQHFSFEGRIIDADIINEEIRSYQSKLSFWQKLSLKLRNISLLVYRSKMCPEYLFLQKKLWRTALFNTWHVFIGYCLFPLAMIGLVIALVKKNLYQEVISLHILTMLYAAYTYIGGVRYRVPYDLMLMILGVLGALKIWEIAVQYKTR